MAGLRLDEVTERCIKQSYLDAGKAAADNIEVNCHLIYDQDPKIFILSRLESEDIQGQFRSFSNGGKRAGNYWHHCCIRAGEKRQGSHRRFGCTAYVSYKLEVHPLAGNVLLERINSQHSGHIPDSVPDKHARIVCSELEEKIKHWIQLGVKPDVILVYAHKWAQENGHHDIDDAAYYVTPADIKNIRKKHLRSTQLHENDSASINKMATDTWKENVVHYRQYIHGEQSLLLVLQTEEMKNDLLECESKMIFMDATNSVNMYGYPLWSLLVVNKFGRGVPVAHVIASEESQTVIAQALTALKNTAGLDPRCFMVDKDFREIEAIKQVFPEAKVLLCYFHVLQAVHRWMMTRFSGLSGTQHGLHRNDVIQFFARLKECVSREAFEAASMEFNNKFEEFPALISYFANNWYPIGHLWANFGRRFNHENADTNNICERFFLRLKYQFLGGVRNRRLDNLVHKLLTTSDEYFTVVHNLRDAGRIRDTHRAHALADSTGAEHLQSRGWADKVTILEDGNYLVPSEFSTGVSYNVNIAECSCTCERANRSLMCKHLHLIRILQLSGDPRYGTLGGVLAADCERLRTNPCLYNVTSQENQVLETYIPLHDCKVFCTPSSCTCPAQSFYNECSHVLLAKYVFRDEVGHVSSLGAQAVPQTESQTNHSELKENNHITKENHEDYHGEHPELYPKGPSDVYSEEHPAILKLKATLSQLVGSSPSPAACQTIDKLHDIVFKKNETNLSRNIKPLHPYRKLIRMKRQRECEASIPLQTQSGKSATSDHSCNALNDHNMAKSCPTFNKLTKESFRIRDRKTAFSRSSAPSVKDIVRRNQKQTEEVPFQGLTISRAAMDYIDVVKTQKPSETSLLRSYLLDLAVQVRLLSEHTLKKLTEEDLCNLLQSYLSSID